MTGCFWAVQLATHLTDALVLDARHSSVTVFWLMAIWMNVSHVVAARWLFAMYQYQYDHVVSLTEATTSHV